MAETSERPKGKSLRPLRELAPFLRPYLGTLYLAMAALVLASAAQLALPVAIRYLIDAGMLAESAASIDRYFLWTGDVRLLLAIIKYCEDGLNVAHDTRYGDVRCILLIEDSVRFYSSYLPLMYAEIMRQTSALLSESINSGTRRVRMRARPKILLAETFEDAVALYEHYQPFLLGVISDIRFPRGGRPDNDAGIERAHLFAQSEGGPMTLLFAATYPDRVDSLILHGSCARIAPRADRSVVR